MPCHPLVHLLCYTRAAVHVRLGTKRTSTAVPSCSSAETHSALQYIHQVRRYETFRRYEKFRRSQTNTVYFTRISAQRQVPRALLLSASYCRLYCSAPANACSTAQRQLQHALLLIASYCMLYCSALATACSTAQRQLLHALLPSASYCVLYCSAPATACSTAQRQLPRALLLSADMS